MLHSCEYEWLCRFLVCVVVICSREWKFLFAPMAPHYQPVRHSQGRMGIYELPWHVLTGRTPVMRSAPRLSAIARTCPTSCVADANAHLQEAAHGPLSGEIVC